MWVLLGFPQTSRFKGEVKRGNHKEVLGQSQNAVG
jgi:hypothetical protein